MPDQNQDPKPMIPMCERPAAAEIPSNAQGLKQPAPVEDGHRASVPRKAKGSKVADEANALGTWDKTPMTPDEARAYADSLPPHSPAQAILNRVEQLEEILDRKPPGMTAPMPNPPPSMPGQTAPMPNPLPPDVIAKQKELASLAGSRRVVAANPMLRWFDYEHLPEHLQAISKPFQGLAVCIVATLKPGPERSVALRKLIESKDAAVRAAVHPGG